MERIDYVLGEIEKALTANEPERLRSQVRDLIGCGGDYIVAVKHPDGEILVFTSNPAMAVAAVERIEDACRVPHPASPPL